MKKTIFILIYFIINSYFGYSQNILGGDTIIDFLKFANHPLNCNSNYVLGLPNDSIWVNFKAGEEITAEFNNRWVDKYGKELLIETGFNTSNYIVKLLLSNNQYSKEHYVYYKDWVQLPNIHWNFIQRDCVIGNSNFDHYMLPLDFKDDFNLTNSDTVIGIKINFLYTTAGPDVAGIYIIKPVICDKLNIGNDTTICSDGIIGLSINIPIISAFLYDSLNHNLATGQNITINHSGTYYIRTEDRCGVQLDTITINQMKCCEMYIPNAFTPNQDGHNDSFSPKFYCNYSNYKMLIYNRWGQVVFQSTNILDTWKGTYGNSNSSADIYFYLISYTDENSMVVHKKGDIELIR